jgi:hypothetical protein
MKYIMPPKQHYIFDGATFTSKTSVDKYIRETKNRIINEGINTIYPDSQYYPFFMEILKNHYNRTEKVGEGIQYFYFIKDGYNNDQLRIQRVDNTDIDCSYMYSKITLPDSYNDNLNSALRYSIECQILEYKRTLPTTNRCKMCDLNIDKYEIDHIIPFDTIKQAFIKIHPPPTAFYDDVNHTCRRIFRKDDHKYDTKWKDYHQKHATYQALCKTCNLKKGKK